MNDWQIARHRVAIAGRVLDANTEKPVAGATVAITAMPEAFEKKLALASLAYGDRWNTLPQRPDRTTSREDGLFYFLYPVHRLLLPDRSDPLDRLDLPDGTYTLSVSIPGRGKRYGTAQQQAVVSSDKDGNFKIAFVTLTLQPTAVSGKVSESGHKSGVLLAEVRVKGSGERTFCDVHGQYILAGIEPGQRTIQVSAQGFKAKAQTVVIPSPGVVQTVNFSLARDT